MARFTFFGGKGGVGKTSMSAAFAHKRARAGEDVLIVSTDPAHSTADVFDQPFGDEPTPVDGYDSLDAIEIDPEQEVTELAHQTPGAHESALFDRFIELMREADHDRVVFDTSPTGGTLRLLSLPEYLGSWIERLVEKREASIDLYEKAAIGSREPRRTSLGDPILARLRDRKERFEFARKTLREDASFVLVANPDALSVRESERAIESLRERDLPVEGVIVNRLTPAPDDDENGRGAKFLRQRIETERERLAELRGFEPPIIAEIETRVSEVKGSFLDEVASELEFEQTI